MKVLIIDNYDSFVYNLAQYIGELSAEPVVFRNDAITLNEAKKLSPDRIIISPGPGRPEDPRFLSLCKEVIRNLGARIPTLGVCLGHQGIIYVFGGEIRRASSLKHGKTSLVIHNEKGIFKGVKNPFQAMRYHSLVGNEDYLPPSIEVTARALDDGEIMGIRHRTMPIVGVQFHPESILTEDGMKIMKNFLEGSFWRMR